MCLIVQAVRRTMNRAESCRWKTGEPQPIKNLYVSLSVIKWNERLSRIIRKNWAEIPYFWFRGYCYLPSHLQFAWLCVKRSLERWSLPTMLNTLVFAIFTTVIKRNEWLSRIIRKNWAETPYFWFRGYCYLPSHLQFAWLCVKRSLERWKSSNNVKHFGFCFFLLLVTVITYT